MDCGGRFEPWMMDFDHRDPMQKLFSLVAENVYLKSRSVLEAEVAKCDVICANCHRIRTAAQYASGVLLNWGWPKLEVHKDDPEAQRRLRKYYRRREEQMEFLNRIRQLPCADCARTFPVCVMEFDHREPSEKKGFVSQMAGRVGIKTLLEEIAKCDIVCANCHRNRSYWQRLAGVAQLVQSDCLPSSRSRVRDPSPAQQLRWIKEPSVAYDVAA